MNNRAKYSFDDGALYTPVFGTLVNCGFLSLDASDFDSTHVDAFNMERANIADEITNTSVIRFVLFFRFRAEGAPDSNQDCQAAYKQDCTLELPDAEGSFYSLIHFRLLSMNVVRTQSRFLTVGSRGF